MKSTLLLILSLIVLNSCKTQEIDAIWMSYQNHVIDYDKAYTSGIEGVIIDFDKQTISTIFSDSIIPIKIDLKQSKLYLKNGTLNVDYKVYGKDSIEIDLGRNMMHVFRPLNLNHKLHVDKSQIKDFLIMNDFKKINGTIDIEFSDKFFFRDVMFEKQNKKNALINKSWNGEGYWYIKEIKQNFFLIFTLDETTDQNIFQIISLDECEMQLIQLQEAEFGIVKVTELKTCL